MACLAALPGTLAFGGAGRNGADMNADPDRLPVIVGVGEIKDRPVDPAHGLEPADLAAAALRRAEQDAGAALLQQVDSLDVVGVVSWPYDDLPALLATRIGTQLARRRHGPIGGHTPVQFLHEAAQRIARGESAVAAVCGAEASHTATAARRRGIALPWTQPRGGVPAQDAGWLPARNRDYLHPLARRHCITEPITVYPLYEGATAAAWGQTPAEASAESALLWSRLSRVAADNPNAWLQRALPEAEIATPSASNRPIAWPYPKLMVANPAVNQGAAILMTSLAVARRLGIPDNRLVHVQGGAAASEPMDWMARDRFDHAAGQDVVLEHMLRLAAGDPTRFGALELYSCFPVVPKMARRLLGVPPGMTPSVAGGLTFHGAPLNNYMTHGAAAMVRALRDRDTLGLLYGQGGYLTWHHGVVLGRQPATAGEVLRPFDHQAEADRRRLASPAVVEAAEGAATVEAFTIVFRPDSQPEHGAVVLRLADGARTLARVPGDDAATLAFLMQGDHSPVGWTGQVRHGGEGCLRWVA